MRADREATVGSFFFLIKKAKLFPIKVIHLCIINRSALFGLNSGYMYP